MITIADRLKLAYARIAQATKKHSRPEQSVALLAVSKTKPQNLIVEAYQAGQRAFGESYVQEAVEKIKALAEYDIQWHFIGPLQSNKSALVAEHFDWVQSVERTKIVTRLANQRPEGLAPLNVLIQVNISEESAKSGCPLEQVDELAQHISQYPNLRLRGLMAIPEKTPDKAILDAQFARLNACFINLKSQYPELDTLSMGMSSDVEAAIGQGSTMVRIGTDIFGPREQPKEK